MRIVIRHTLQKNHLKVTSKQPMKARHTNAFVHTVAYNSVPSKTWIDISRMNTRITEKLFETMFCTLS